MKTSSNAAVQSLKDQAGRLSTYLSAQGLSLSRTQSLEAMSRAVHAKPWNTVRAGLKSKEVAPAAKPGHKRYVQFSCAAHNGARQPLSVTANLTFGSLVMSVNLNTVLDEMPDDLVLALIEGEAGRWPEIYRRIESQSDGLFKGQTAEATQLAFATTFGDGMGLWVKAFRPHLLWAYMASKEFESLAQARSLHQCYVDEDPDQPGLWVYVMNGEGCDYSFDSRLQAELALCDKLSQRCHELKHAQDWEHLLTVRAGSGRCEDLPAAGSPLRVAGRLDEDTGELLYLEKGPLSTRELQRITDFGRYSLDIAVPVDVWELASQDLEWLNDQVSEHITGSICDLEDLAYRRADTCVQTEASPPQQVWIRVSAQWTPVDADFPD